eukprot:RCo051241
METEPVLNLESSFVKLPLDIWRAFVLPFLDACELHSLLRCSRFFKILVIENSAYPLYLCLQWAFPAFPGALANLRLVQSRVRATAPQILAQPPHPQCLTDSQEWDERPLGIKLWECRRSGAFGDEEIVFSLMLSKKPLNPFLWRLSPAQLLQLLPPALNRRAYLVPSELQVAFEAQVLPKLRALLGYPTQCEILAWNSYFYGAGPGTWKDHLPMYGSREDVIGANVCWSRR